MSDKSQFVIGISLSGGQHPSGVTVLEATAGSMLVRSMTSFKQNERAEIRGHVLKLVHLEDLILGSLSLLVDVSEVGWLAAGSFRRVDGVSSTSVIEVNEGDRQVPGKGLMMLGRRLLVEHTRQAVADGRLQFAEELELAEKIYRELNLCTPDAAEGERAWWFGKNGCLLRAVMISIWRAGTVRKRSAVPAAPLKFGRLAGDAW